MVQSPAEGETRRATTPDDAVLQRVVDLSDENSGDDLRISLVRTIFELFATRKISFYELAHRNPDRLNETFRALAPSWPNSAEPIFAGIGERGLLARGALAKALRSRELSCDMRDGAPPVFCFPVLAGDRVLELVRIEFAGDTRRDAAVLGAVAQLYGNVIRLMWDKDLDTLTGVLNRRAFEARLGAVMSRIARTPPTSATPWLAMVDVDHFKAINDNFGHVVGDEVLLLLARKMLYAFRNVDGVYRYGGEEFAVILQDCTRAEAVSALERCREEIAASRFPQAGQVTISAGLAAIERFEHVSTVVGRADQALYAAKRAGRNQICEAGEAGPGADQHEVELF